jgi:putative transposase
VNEEKLTAKKVADILGLTKSAVLKRANREEWQFSEINNKAGGGSQRVYLIESLPDDVKSKLFQYINNCPPELLPPKDIDLDKAGDRLGKWNQASKKHRDRAAARSEILKAVDFLCHDKGCRQTRGEEVFVTLYRDRKAPGIDEATYNIEQQISVATIRRWRRSFRQDGLPGLLPNYRSNQGRLKAITPDIQIFLIGEIKKKPHIRSAHLYKLVSKTFERSPARRTIYRFAAQWKHKNQPLWAMIEDPQRWKNNYMPAAGDMSAGVDHFCHTWEMDSTPADIITSDNQRCAIIGTIDVFSRRAIIIVAPTSKSIAVASCKRKGFISWGIPSVIRKDNGKDYSSNHIEAIVTALQIETPTLPKYTPEKKPFIERFFGSFSMGLEELLPGYCGHSVADRQSIRARKTWAAKIMAPGATVEVPLTLKEFQVLCDKWIEIYENSPHEGLNGKTPYQKFKESTYFPQKISDERVLDVLLAPVSKPRRVLKKGISIEGQYYWADELINHIGSYVKCRLDLENAGLVYVFSTSKDSSFICRATSEPLSGQRLEDYLKAKNKNLKELKEKTKALDGLALGNRDALQILIEDGVLNRKHDNLIPLQFEADNPAIREARKAVHNAKPAASMEIPDTPKAIYRSPADPVYDDYKTDADLDREMEQYIADAAAKKALGVVGGKGW